MKKPTYKGKELLPLSVIDAARDGDSQAVEQLQKSPELASALAALIAAQAPAK